MGDRPPAALRAWRAQHASILRELVAQAAAGGGGEWDEAALIGAVLTAAGDRYVAAVAQAMDLRHALAQLLGGLAGGDDGLDCARRAAEVALARTTLIPGVSIRRTVRPPTRPLRPAGADRIDAVVVPRPARVLAGA